MKLYITSILCFLILQACPTNQPVKFSVQGHRGDRGNWPENSLYAFKSAIEKGVDVIELDVVINKFNDIIVSHEPFMHSDYVLQPNGQPIHPKQQKNYNIYHMTLDSVQKYNTGSKYYAAFPNQIKISSYKPSLKEVFKFIKKEFDEDIFNKIAFNIELKSDPENYDKFQPQPEKMVSVFLKLMEEYPWVQYSLQSFDVKILEHTKKLKPEVVISYLVSKGSFDDNINKLNFTPDIYSPYYKLLTTTVEVKNIQNHGLKVIPWTVNDITDIRHMISLKVDGIISDYPERILPQIFHKKKSH